MSLKAKASTRRCYLCAPAVTAALYGMPACSSDVISSLHSVWIPMAPSLFGCHTTLVPCYYGAQCIVGTNPPPLTCCWRVKGAINNHCALVVHSCVAQQGITHAAWLVSHSAHSNTRTHTHTCTHSHCLLNKPIFMFMYHLFKCGAAVYGYDKIK